MSLLRSCSFFIFLSGLYLVSSSCYKSTAAQLEDELRDLHEIPLHNLSTYDSGDLLKKWNCSNEENPNSINQNEKEAEKLGTQVEFADTPASSDIINTNSTGNPFYPNTYVAVYRKIFDSQTDEMFAPSSNVPIAVVANVSVESNSSAPLDVDPPSPTQTLGVDVTEIPDIPASSDIINTNSTFSKKSFYPNTYVAVYRKIFNSQTDEMFAPSSKIPVAVVANVSLESNSSAPPNLDPLSPTQNQQALEINATESNEGIFESASSKNNSLSHDKDSIRHMSHYIPVNILLGETHGITFLNATYPEDSIYINKTDFNVFSVDYKFATKEIYFAANKGIRVDAVVGRLSRARPSEVVVADEVDGSVSLAVDWVHDRLYWMSVNHQTVEAADIDGNNRTLLINVTTGVKYPNNINVDPYKRFLFFIANNTIYRSNLNGRSLVAIHPLDNTSKTIRCLTLDVASRRLFFTGKLKTSPKVYIASSDYEGETVKFHDIGGTGWTDVYSMSVFREGLYFAHYNPRLQDSVWFFNISWTGKRPVKVYDAPTSRGGIWSIKVYDAEVQKESDKQGEKRK